jgi:hypothetical protein
MTLRSSSTLLTCVAATFTAVAVLAVAANGARAGGSVKSRITLPNGPATKGTRAGGSVGSRIPASNGSAKKVCNYNQSYGGLFCTKGK